MSSFLAVRTKLFAAEFSALGQMVGFIGSTCKNLIRDGAFCIVSDLYSFT